ncbi:MAG TPA: P-loop NTPase, partial [Pirellulaceae bacterium]
MTILDQAYSLRQTMHRLLPTGRCRSGAAIVAVASGGGSAGATMITVQLAAALTQKGHSVCCLDTDPSRRDLEQMTGVEPFEGMTLPAAE